MYVNYSNNMRQVNGAVRPSMVLWSRAEMRVAQNAHNFVWDAHWNECETLDKKSPPQKMPARLTANMRAS